MNPNASIPALFAAHAAAHSGDTILRKKQRGIWHAMSWTELAARVRDVAAGLQAIGFRPGDVACTLAETGPEWVAVDLGVLAAGGVSGGIHPAEEAEQLGMALNGSGCRVLFVENEQQLDNALLARDRCPALQHIVIFDMKGLREFSDPMCQSFQAFVARGSGQAGDWMAGIGAIAADDPAILLFPYGAAGAKARMLTHGDVLHLIANARSLLSVRAGDERLALLPMCNMMERVFGLYLSLDTRAISNYLENPDTVVENLQELQPTVLAADSQIWQRLHARIDTASAGATWLQRALYRWAIAVAQSDGAQSGLARLLVLRAVRRDLGLGHLRSAYIGAQPLAPEIARWVTALGIDMKQIDGQASAGNAVDARYRDLMQEAYGT